MNGNSVRLLLKKVILDGEKDTLDVQFTTPLLISEVESAETPVFSALQMT